MSEKKEREEDVDNNEANNKKANTIDPEIQKAGERHVETLLKDLITGEIKDHDADEWFVDVVIELINIFKIDKEKITCIIKPYVLSLMEKNEMPDGDFVKRIKMLENYL